MQAEFWLQRWQHREIGFHEPHGSAYLPRYWPSLALAPQSRVLVPLCGKSRDLLWLAEQGHDVIGCELSDIAANEFFAEASLTPRTETVDGFTLRRAERIAILQGDFFRMNRPVSGHIDAVFDRAALIAMPPDMRPAYARKLTELLDAPAQVLLITPEYDQTQMKGPPFAVLEDEIQALFSVAFVIDKLARTDVLDHNPRFRQRGLTALGETVYRMRKR